MADNNALHFHSFAPCERPDQKENDAKQNSQAKIVDYYRPKHGDSASLSQPPVGSANTQNSNDKIDNSSITRMLLEDVCKELDSIEIIVTKPHNNVVEVVECLKQLNGDSSDTSPKSVLTPNGGQVVLSSAGNSAVTFSSDLTALQRKKLSTFRDTLDPLVDVGVTHSNVLLSANEQCSLSTSTVENSDLYDDDDEEEDDQGEAFADHNSNLELDASNASILSNSSFNVTDSSQALENSVDLQQMHCISIDIVTEDAENLSEQPNCHESVVNCIPETLLESSVSERKEPVKKHTISHGPHKSMEHRNTKARRITAKMKMAWAKELQAAGRLVCPMQGCHQTYVTVANFQTHYKWCTGKKNLQHCPYCESLIFAGHEAVLHHMEVEHPEKVNDYKEACATDGANQNMQQTSNPVIASRPFGKKISKKYYKMKNLKNCDFSSKENILSQKKPLNHGLKTIEKTMDQNFKEFKKCVRFNDIVQKINSVSDEPKDCSENINSTKIRAKPFKPKKGVFLEENSETCYFSDENEESVDSPHPVNEDQEKPRKVTTKSRIVLNTQGYERFNQYLKLTRDWASERRTYSRNRSGDSSISTAQNETLPMDVQDTYQLNDSVEPAVISLSVNEPVNSLYAPLSLSRNSPDVMSSTAVKTPIKKLEKPFINHQAKLKKNVSDNELHLKSFKTEIDSNTQKGAKFSSIQNSIATDPNELNYGHVVFSKPNKVTSRAHTTCYDNAGNLRPTSKPDLSQESSKNQESTDCPPPPPPVIDFDTLLQSTASVSKEKQQKKHSTPHDNSLEPGAKVQSSSASGSSNEEKLKGNKASKYRKQDGVKLPKSTSAELKTKKRAHSKKDEPEINPVMYNEALKMCFNEEVSDLRSTPHTSTKEGQPERQMEALCMKSMQKEKRANEKSKGIKSLKKLAFVVVNSLFTRTCNSLSKTDISSFMQEINKGSIFNACAARNCRDCENPIDSTCRSILQNLIDQVSNKLSNSGSVMPNLSLFHVNEHPHETCALCEQGNNGLESRSISAVSSLWKAYFFSLDSAMHSKYISNISSGFESYLVKTFPTFSLQKKRGRPPKKERASQTQFLELKHLLFENSMLNCQNSHLLSQSVISQGTDSSLIDKDNHTPQVTPSVDSSMNVSALNLPECKQKKSKRRRKDGGNVELVSCPTQNDADVTLNLNASVVQSTNDTGAEKDKSLDVAPFTTSTPVPVKKGRGRGRPRKNGPLVSSETDISHKDTQSVINSTENTTYSVTAPDDNSAVTDSVAADAASEIGKIKSQSILPTDSSEKVESTNDVSLNKSKKDNSNKEKQPLQAVRKSTRLRKRKIDPDTLFLHPKKITRTSSLSRETISSTQPDVPVKKGKRGRPKKKVEGITLSDPPKCVQEIENHSKNSLIVHSCDSGVSLSVPTDGSAKTGRNSSNLALEAQKVQSTARRKGRPRKCLRYADLNSGIDIQDDSEVMLADRVANQSDKIVEKKANVINSVNNLDEEKEKSKPSRDADTHVLPENVTEDANSVPVDKPEVTVDPVPPVATPEEQKTSKPPLKKNKFFKAKRKIKMSAIKQHQLHSFSKSRIMTSYKHPKDKAGLLSSASKTKVIKAKVLTRAKSLQRTSSNTHVDVQKSIDSPTENHVRKTRSAALKARKMFGRLNRRLSTQDLSDELTVDGDFIPPKRFYEPRNAAKELSNYESYFYAPSVEARSASAAQISEWVKELELNGRIICGQSGCEKILETKAGMVYHYEHACLKAERKWHCKICKKAMKPSHEIMLSHFKKHHRTILKPEGRSTPGEPKLKKPTVMFDYQEGSSLSVAECSELFPEFKPRKNLWKEICCEKLEEFIPFSKSVNLKLCDLWFSLAPFESYEKNINTSQATFFVGGPVSASCWCPTPSDKKSKQYIFLVTSSKMLKYHHSFSTGDEKSLLQVWDCGHLQGKNMVTVQPTLKIAVTLKCGKVWCIASCPYGCWEDPSSQSVEKEFLPRLGLVAAACTDGLVRVFSFPHPESLSSSPERHPFYDAQPVAVLQSAFNEPSLLSRNAMCTSLSWQRTDKCELIAAGYSNGLVSLWRLTSTSGLLVKKSDCGVIISPFLTLPAHSTSVTCIDFSPLPGGRYFATGGSDKTLKIWDLYQPEAPSFELRKAIARGVQWPTILSGAFVCFEEGFISKSTTCYQDLSIFTKKRNVVLHTRGSLGQMCFSVSEFLNMAALGGTTGEVTASPLFGLNMEQCKSVVSQQYPIFHTEVKSIPAEEAKAVNDSGNSSSCEHNDSSQVVEADNTSCDAISSTCGLAFTDVPLNDNTTESSSKNEAESVHKTDDVNLPASECNLASISTVCWNPNKGSHCWLFTANQAGVARLLCILGLGSQRS